MIYIISDKIKFKTFKLLQDRLVKADLIPKNINKVLWEMLRDKQIYCWFSDELKNDMCIGLKLPLKKGEKYKIIN